MVAHSGRGWRLAPSLIALESEANGLASGRLTISDGSIGDTEHQTRSSDHNPKEDGWVDGLDLTHDPRGGFDAHGWADTIAQRGDPRLKYIISNRRIHDTRRDGPGQWRRYTGTNSHARHIHVSVLPSGRMDTRPWLTAAPSPQPPPYAPTPQPPPYHPPAPTGVPEMFLAIDSVGLFAVIDGIPIPFPDLAAMGDAKRRSDGIPMMWLPKPQGEQMLAEMLKKHKAALT